jgi:hypothetical protein
MSPRRPICLITTLTLATAGCFDIAVPAGSLRCVDRCPDGMECIGGLCYPEGWMPGADAALDVPGLDADAAPPDRSLPGETTADIDPSWPYPGWGFRKTIVIDKSMFKGSDTDFPVVISRSADPDLAAHAQAGGADLLFTLPDHQKLAHEIERCEAGTLVAWVKLPSYAEGADAVLLMYYGNKNAAPQEQPTQVWTNGYEAVWHMDADPTGQVPDSTGRHPGTSRGSMTAADLVDGQLGKGIDFDGSDDALDVGSFDVTGSGSDGGICLEAWVYSRSGKGRVISKATGIQDADHVWMLAVGASDQNWYSADFRVRTSSVSWLVAPGALQGKTWTFVAGNFSGTKQRIYLNGSIPAEKSLQGTVAADPAVAVSIGDNPVGARPFDGVLDEVRVSRVSRPASWLHTQQRNHSDPDAYIKVGAEEPRPY